MGRHYDEYLGARVEAIVRMMNSVNGNARFKMVISTPQLVTIKTSVDSSYAYVVKNLSEGDLIDVQVAAGGSIVGITPVSER